jgi:FkbM family methyltransferase
VIRVEGLWWPDDVAGKWRHALKHLHSLDWALQRLASRGRPMRTAVQAGGNVGLWPQRMAERGFARVVSFEPDATCRACLARNVSFRVQVRPEALGEARHPSGLRRASLGSHALVPGGEGVDVMPLDELCLTDVDLLQLDVEGYEWHALAGATETLARCKPLVQVELREFTRSYGRSDREVTALLAAHGYRQVALQPGNDVVYEVPA